MKKLFSIALSMLMLISCFAISASAEEVNYAQNENAAYVYIEDMSSSWYGSLADDACELLTDGNIPYAETPFESVGVQGSNKIVTIVFDLGANYPDVKQIKFCGVWDSFNHGSSGQNRSFSGDKTMFRFSQDGANFERNKNFEMTKENWSEDGSENGFYNFVFTFDEDVTAKAVEVTFYSPTYVMSLGEIQIIGGGADPVEPEISEEESSEEIIESEDESEEPAESADESVAESEAEESADESVAESEAEESKADESKADESKADESKADDSKAPTSQAPAENDGGISPVVIIIIIVAVIAIAAVVVIIMKKRG